MIIELSKKALLSILIFGLVLGPNSISAQAGAVEKAMSKVQQREVGRLAKRCKIDLGEPKVSFGKKAMKVAGYVLPIIPIADLFGKKDAEGKYDKKLDESNKEKRRFVFLENPFVLGIPSGIAATALATFLNGKDVSFADMHFWTHVWESWSAYNLANIPRTGVKLGKLTERSKYWLNVWYSGLFYSIITASGKLTGDSHVELVHGVSLIVFSMVMWPFFSQWVGNNITVPTLFSKFPSSNLMKELKDPSFSKAALLEKYRKKEEASRQSLNEIDLKLREIAEARSDKKTAEITLQTMEQVRSQLRDLVKDADKKAGQELDYYENKMNELEQIEDFDLVDKYLKKELKEARRLTKMGVGAAKWSQRWIKALTYGMKVGERIGRGRRAMLYGVKILTSMTITSIMIPIYFSSRWFSVGYTPEEASPLHSAVEEVWPE